MPINFLAVAVQFEAPLLAQTERLPLLFARLARTAQRLRREVEQADRATRALPLVRFRDGALSVRALSGVMARAAGPSVTGSLGRGAAAFADGVAWVGTAVHQELLLPRLGQAAADVLGRVEVATDRVLQLEPSLFDTAPGGKRRYELPALLALGTRMRAEAGLIRPAPSIVAPPADRVPSAETDRWIGHAQAVDPASLPLLLTDLTAALVIALPASTVVLVGRVRILSLEAKVRVVDELTKVERLLLGVHTKVADLLLGTAGPVEVAAGWFPIIQAMVEGDLDLLTRWLPRVTGELLEGIDRFVEAVNASSQVLVLVVGTVLFFVEAVTSFDLLGPLGGAFAAAGLPPASLTIGQLIDAGSVAAAKLAALKTAELLGEVSLVATPLSPRDGRIFFWLSRMMAALGGHSIGAITVPAPPTPAAPFPDVVGLLFPKALDTVLADYARDTVLDVRGAVVGALHESAGLAGDLQQTVGRITAEAKQGLGGLPLADAARAADAFTEKVVGGERAFRGQAPTQPDAFVTLFSTVGFHLVGGLMALYLAGVRRTAQPVAPPAPADMPRPTSPHILAEHRRLAGVRTTSVRIRAAGEPTDAGSAAAVADRLRAAFGQLYLDGQRQVDAAAGSR